MQKERANNTGLKSSKDQGSIPVQVSKKKTAKRKLDFDKISKLDLRMRGADGSAFQLTTTRMGFGDSAPEYPKIPEWFEYAKDVIRRFESE